jgi:hypothetical protein
MRTLVYVDKELIVAVGALLVGSSKSISAGGGASINILLQTHIDASSSTTRDLSELLPEHVFYKCHDKISNKFSNTKDATTALHSFEQNQIIPGTPVSVAGILSFPDLQTIGVYDPFKPPSIDVETFEMYGEACFAGSVEKDGYKLPVYFPTDAKNQVCFLQREPVEVVGIVRWSPGYKAGGGKTLNMLIRAVALLLG